MVNVPCSGQIDGFLERALLKLIPYSLLPSQKEKDRNILCKKPSKPCLDLGYSRSAHNWNHCRLYSGLGHLNWLLVTEVEDSRIWRLATKGQYSAKSSYDSLFLGATLFKSYERIWKSWAPPKCWLFLWLAAHKRCWTSDCLAKHGLPHLDKCPMCDQYDETIDHLLVACMFTRQFWYHMLRQVDLHSFTPQPTYSIFDIWWEGVAAATSGLTKKGLNSLIILEPWTIWNHATYVCSMGPILIWWRL
jgi:hypothetical protein